MFFPFLRGPAWLVLVAFALASPAQAQTLSKPEVARIGKAATALVEARAGKASGSALCIHAAGFFITNEHVVRGDAGTVRLVLNSGLDTQKIVKARVVRVDGPLDLALLRAEGEGKYPALPLGSDRDLGELTELVVFGFPFGKDLTFDKDSFPSVTVNAGTVTRLPRKGGALHRIQMDAAVNPGCSGGPVLDMSGKVIGVVVAGVDGTTLNFAIPVSHVARFLARPDIQFTPPVLERANLHQPAVFEARAISVLPSAGPITLELILGTEEQRQKVAMKLVDGVHRATAVPVPRPRGPAVLRVMARSQDRTVEGSVGDRPFQVGESKLQLRDVSRLRGGDNPRVVLLNGKTLKGKITGLDAVPVRVGQQTTTLDLGRASDATLEAPDEEPFIDYTLVATRDGKEIGRVSDLLSVRGVPQHGLGIRPPVLSQDKIVAQLPAPAADLTVGGGGRFLVLHLPKLGKLAVFDVNKPRITHFFPVDGDVKFVAGLDRLVVLSPGKNLVQRFSLRSFEEEMSVSLPIKGVVKTAALGSASNGPLLVHWAVGTNQRDRSYCTFFDIQTMRPLPLKGKGLLLGGHGQWFPDVLHFRAAPDGTAFGLWCTSHTPNGLQALLVAGNEVRSPYQHTSVGHVVPGPGGLVLYTGAGVFTNDLQKLRGAWPEGHAFLPAQEGGYFLAVGSQLGLDMPRPSSPGGNAPDKVLIYQDQDDQPVATLSNIEIPQPGNAWTRDDFTFDKRVHFIPAARLLITVPTSNDRLVLHRVSVEAALARRALLVSSRGPAVVKNGETYRYRLEVQSQKGGLEYRLDAGPPGMTVSRDGLIEWNVPARLGPATCSVQITVQDPDGQKCEHRFSLRVEGGEPLLAVKPGNANFDVVLNPARGRLASVTPQAITVWDLVTGKEIRRLEHHDCRHLALSGNGERLAACTMQEVHERDTNSDREIVQWKQEVRVWNIDSGKEIIHLKGEQLGRSLGELVLSSDGAQVAAIVHPRVLNNPSDVIIWDAATGKKLHTLAGELPQGALRLTFSPDGKRLAADFGSVLKLWDVAREELVADAKAPNVQSLSFSPDSSRLAFSTVSSVAVLDAATGQELFSLLRSTPTVQLLYSPDSKRLVCCGHSGMSIHDAGTGKELAAVASGPGVLKPSFSRDGKWLALMAPTEQFPPTPTLRLCDAVGREVLTLTGQDGIRSAHILGPDGKLLATQGRDGTWKVWQLAR